MRLASSGRDGSILRYVFLRPTLSAFTGLLLIAPPSPQPFSPLPLLSQVAAASTAPGLSAGLDAAGGTTKPPMLE